MQDDPEKTAAGFTIRRKDRPDERWLLIGSHTSTVRIDRQPFRKMGCAGCAILERPTDEAS